MIQIKQTYYKSFGIFKLLFKNTLADASGIALAHDYYNFQSGLEISGR